MSDPIIDQDDLFSALTVMPFSSDPNSSFELRDMVTVAASYFERTMLGDAEEMIQEAIAGGYTQTDALVLNRRIQGARAEANGSLVDADAPATTTDRAISAVHHQFTIPLPGIELQSDTIRQAVLDSENDIRAHRLQSALDATLNALSRAPRFLPLHIRLAELRVAAGDPGGAEVTLNLLRTCLAMADDDTDWLMLSMRVMLDSNDTGSHTQLARSLLNHRGTMQLEPFVPESIERAIEHDPANALELANDYYALKPMDPYVQSLRLRATAAAAIDDAISAVFRADVRRDMASDLLYLRSAIAFADGRDAWIEWLECATARLEQSSDGATFDRMLAKGRRFMPAAQFALSAAIVRLTLQDWEGALTFLEPWGELPTRETSDARDMLVAACARAFALRAYAPIESIAAFSRAVGQAVVIDVRPFAESCSLFRRSIAADALMAELVEVARDTGQSDIAISHLQTLRDRMPEHLEIRTGLATLQVAAGRISEGVRELRYIAERYEQAGNFERMVEAMRHMSDAVPNNHEIKAMLIDSYIQRGIPDEATRELGLLGNIYQQRGRFLDASGAYVRGAEIAATTGDTPRAIELFERAVAANPDDVAVRHAAVAFFIMNGSIDRASLQLWEIVRVALQEDDPDEAVAALHQLIALAPNDASAYHKLGEVLTSLGEYAQAERVYRRLAVFTVDDPVLIAKQAALAALADDRLRSTSTR